MDNFVVVATFTYPHEYAVLKMLLEQDGIRYVFENETMVHVSPFYSYAVGGIRLKVHRNDVASARALMDQLDKDESPLRVV